MAEKYKSKAELQAENDVLRSTKNVNAWAKTIQSFFKWGFLALVVYFVTNVGHEWSGKHTVADIKIIADVKAEGGLSKGEAVISKCPKGGAALCPETLITKEVPVYAWLMGLLGAIFGFAGIVYGRIQALLRKNVVEFYHPRIKELELALDEKRSSSRLTPRGETRPEDH